MQRILGLPFLVILAGLSAIAMLVPMAHAVRLADFFTARVFLHSGLLFFTLVSLIGIATSNYSPRNTARSHLIALFGAFVFLPLFLAFPLMFLVPDTPFFWLYFEMLSCLTTTGASVFDDPTRLSDPVHLWRALVAWLGGLMMLVSAVAILAPLNLGGFEVYATNQSARKVHGAARIRAADVSDRLVSFAIRITPIYLGFTGLLALGLLLCGERVFVSVIIAMSTVSTSGISPGEGFDVLSGGVAPELLIFLFLFLAISRWMFSSDHGRLPSPRAVVDDHEFKLVLFFLTVVPVLLLARHWIGAFDFNEQENTTAALSALWGSVFMVLSFLSTTGFESDAWHMSQDWSGLQAPAIILIGLVVVGGGVATTAGGVKLLRIYALSKHGMREMQKLSFPSSIAGAGKAARHIRREGAYVAWMFFMLFAISTALIMLALALRGLSFEESLAFGVAALSTTGPLAGAVLDGGASYASLDDWARAILCAAMVVGRLETLAIIALLNPDFWRR